MGLISAVVLLIVLLCVLLCVCYVFLCLLAWVACWMIGCWWVCDWNLFCWLFLVVDFLVCGCGLRICGGYWFCYVLCMVCGGFIVCWVWRLGFGFADYVLRCGYLWLLLDLMLAFCGLLFIDCGWWIAV